MGQSQGKEQETAAEGSIINSVISTIKPLVSTHPAVIPPTTRPPPSRIYAFDTCEERLDPATTLTNEIFLDILSQVHFRDVATQCALVSKAWNELCNASQLWKQLLFVQHVETKEALTEFIKLELEDGIMHPFHPHPLLPHAVDDGWICDAKDRVGGCRRGITQFHQTAGVPRFKCASCDFDLCDKCLEDLSLTDTPLLRNKEEEEEKKKEKEKQIQIEKERRREEERELRENEVALLVNRLEEQDNGLKVANEELSASQYRNMNEWKKYFAWKMINQVRWAHDNAEDIYELKVSENGLRAYLAPGKTAHASAWGTRGFSKGVHTWKVRVDGLDATGFWAALGVASETKKRHFSYNTCGVFTGYSGAGNIFSYEGEQYQGTAKRWKNGDIITMTLDCNKRELHFWINDEQQPTLKTLDSTLWPWANGYVPGCSMTIIP